MKKNHKKLLIFIAILLTPLFLLFLAEVYFRSVVTNNYLWPVNPNEESYTRLYVDNKGGIVNLKGLYKTDNPIIRCQVENNYILSNKPHSKITGLLFGASAVACASVEPGFRIADLIGDGTLNFAVSAGLILDSFMNFKYIITHRDYKEVKRIFVMHGANDLGVFIVTKNPKLVNDINGVGRFHWKGKYRKRYRKSYLLRYLLKTYFGNTTKIAVVKARQKRKSNIAVPLISSEEFVAWKNDKKLQQFLINREKALLRFINFSKKKQLRLYFLTEPHAFQENYKPSNGEDLRTYLLINNKRTTVKQSRELMDLVNNHTCQIAKKYKVELIDISKYFYSLDVSEFLYDGFHLTKKGSEKAARLVQEHIKKEK